MSLHKLGAGRITRQAKEMHMDWIAQMPEWWDWCAAGIVGAVALAALASMLEAALDLDAN
jgi:hypothetical protein